MRLLQKIFKVNKAFTEVLIFLKFKFSRKHLSQPHTHLPNISAEKILPYIHPHSEPLLRSRGSCIFEIPSSQDRVHRYWLIRQWRTHLLDDDRGGWEGFILREASKSSHDQRERLILRTWFLSEENTPSRKLQKISAGVSLRVYSQWVSSGDSGIDPSENLPILPIP